MATERKAPDSIRKVIMSSPAARYPPEFRERAVRMVAEVRPKYASEWAAIRAVASDLGIKSPDTLRKWVRQSRLSQDERVPGSTKIGSLLKKSFFRTHPIITGAAILIFGGLGLSYSQLILGTNKRVAALEVDEVTLLPGSSRTTFLPFVMDIKLLNTGSQLAVINSARLVIQEFARVPECASQGDFPSTGYYPANMPIDPKIGTIVNIPISQLVQPNGADRFDLALRAPLVPHELFTVYLYRVHMYLYYNAVSRPIDLGEIFASLPIDPTVGGAYFWTRYFSTHPQDFAFLGPAAAGVENCLIKNSRALDSILSLPAKRTAQLAAIPSQLAFCCATSTTAHGQSGAYMSRRRAKSGDQRSSANTSSYRGAAARKPGSPGSG